MEISESRPRSFSGALSGPLFLVASFDVFPPMNFDVYEDSRMPCDGRDTSCVINRGGGR